MSNQRSDDISKNHVELPQIRLSSASKKNHSTNETRIQSPIKPHDINEVNHQTSLTDHSRSSFHDDPLTNTHSHRSNLHHEQNQSNSLANSDHFPLHDDDDHLNNAQRQSIESTYSNPRQRHNSDKTHENHKIPETLKADHANISHPSCTFRADKKWLDPQYVNELIQKPDELEKEMKDPPGEIDKKILDRIQGSIIGLALGDALGARVEFRPYEYMRTNPVTSLEGGGTWGLQTGQFTDDTSMALCLANSLLACKDFIPYDQLVRYKWWYKDGYMSSTGQCFDIGTATSQSLNEFEDRQKTFAEQHSLPHEAMDHLADRTLLGDFPVYCSEDDVAGNGALMRLAPVPLFFFRNKYAAVEFSGRSGEITHGDKKSYDACRYYGALIVAALHGYKKKQILARNFYSAHKHWFGEEPLHHDIQSIAEGSFKKTGGYQQGIRGKGYIVNALEAALWAFWSDEDSFEKGALAAVNLGDDTDTTAAIYGQLAGAYYGYKELPKHWVEHVYARRFMEKISKWIVFEGDRWTRELEHSNK